MQLVPVHPQSGAPLHDTVQSPPPPQFVSLQLNAEWQLSVHPPPGQSSAHVPPVQSSMQSPEVGHSIVQFVVFVQV